MEMTSVEDVVIKVLTVECPTCGSRLKYKRGDLTVTCPFCDYEYSVTESHVTKTTTSEPASGNWNGGGSVQKIEGMQTPSSVLAYVEQYFDNYDWDAFAYDDDLSIFRIDRMLEKIKTVSADDFKTWVSAFLAIVVPLNKKIEYCDKVFNAAVQEYKKDNADAFSMYESYKRVVRRIISDYDDRIELAKKYLGYAAKYGIPNDYEKSLLNMIKPNALVPLKGTMFASIYEIPVIAEFIKEQEELLKKQLLEAGINAEETYSKAIRLYEEKNYKEALSLFYSLCGFKDSEDYIESMNRYSFLADSALITDDCYFYATLNEIDKKSHTLYRVKDKKIEKKSLLPDMYKIICNYGGTIIYFTAGSNNNLRALNVFTGDVTKILGSYIKSAYHEMLEYGKIYLIGIKNEKEEYPLEELDLATLNVKKVFTSSDKNFVFFDNHIIYKKKGEEDKVSTYDYDTLLDETFLIASKDVSVVGVDGDRYFVTMVEPDKENKGLFYIDKKENSELVLIENNIVDPVEIVDDRIYYFTRSNTGYHYLIGNDFDGKDRIEISSRVKDLLFKQGDWIYCIRGSGYNTVLGRMKADGSCYQSIASQIDEFVKIENGFIYYINDQDDFYCVRMDGGKSRLLAKDVTLVLEINENSVIFSAGDKDGESIYEIEFGRKGHRKLVYQVEDGCKYDKKNIYYITLRRKTVNGVSQEIRHLKRTNIETYEEETLFGCQNPAKGCYVATCVYGSYDCPQVWMLRRYRDFYLDEHWWGRAFIKLYYAISPKIVKIFGKNSLFQKISRHFLDKKIKRLKKAGYQDTSYIDKY